GAAPAGGDPLRLSTRVLRFVAHIVMEVAGERHRQAGRMSLRVADVAVLEVAQGFEGFRSLGDSIDPARLGRAEDDPVPFLDLVLPDLVEIPELRLVDEAL